MSTMYGKLIVSYFFRNAKGMNLLECAIYNENNGGQAVAHWIRFCKENSIDVLDELCRSNKDMVRTSAHLFRLIFL